MPVVGGEKTLLSFDLSLNRTGYVVGKVVNGKLTIVETGVIDNNKILAVREGEKLMRIANKVKELLVKYEPDYVVKEGGFSNNNLATKRLYAVHGVVTLMCWCYGHHFEDVYQPTTIKKQLTGNGRAKKEQVAEALKRFVGDIEFEFDDESDAVAILITHCLKTGLISENF